MCHWYTLKNVIPERPYGYCRLASLSVGCSGVKASCICKEDLREWDVLKQTLCEKYS